MTNEQAHEIIKAQAKLLMHLTERVVMLQVAVEAFIHGQVGEEGAEHDAHYAHRKELFEQESKAKTNGLLHTLSKALDRIDNDGNGVV